MAYAATPVNSRRMTASFPKEECAVHAQDVIDLYRDLENAGVYIWIDGGWAIDAVLGRETRAHSDLDIAIEDRAVSALRRHLAQRGFQEAPRADTRWNFLLSDDAGRHVDVHVVVLDDRKGVQGEAVDGIRYPAGSLSGAGVIAGVAVRCVRADDLLQFKTSYPPRPVDRADVAALCALLGRPVPDTHL